MAWLDINKRINGVSIKAGDLCVFRACEISDLK